LNQARLDDTKHAIVISNNHVAEAFLEPTPKHWQNADTPGSRTAAFMAMLYATLLGDVIGWATQQQGRLITNVVPTPGQEDSMVSSSSLTTLGWHTEDAFSASRADHIGLFCLRNPDQTPTTMSYLDPDRLGADVLSVLRQPRFFTRPDPAHSHAAEHVVVPSPLLHGPPDAPTLGVDRDFTEAVPGDAAAEHALSALVAHLDANLYGLALSPGDMCFVDNRNVVHGRAAFVPRYDGTDRWLKRVSVVTDLRRTRPDRPGGTTRVIG